MNYSIRTMQVEDIPEVYAIEQQGHAFPWTEGLLRDCVRVGYHCWVVETEGKIAGFLIVQTAANECHILNICVHPHQQGQGLGSRLLEHLLAEVRQQPVARIFLEVRSSNTVAQKLYEKFGFRKIGVRLAYYPAVSGRENAIVLALDRTPPTAKVI